MKKRQITVVMAIIPTYFKVLKPFWFPKIVGFPIENDVIGNKVKVIVATTDTLIARLQQVFMLVNHTEPEMAIQGHYKFGERNIFLITLQGLPTATVFEGMSLTTTEPAPMVTLSPMVTPGRMVTLPPIQTLLPMVTGFAHS